MQKYLYKHRNINFWMNNQDKLSVRTIRTKYFSDSQSLSVFEKPVSEQNVSRNCDFP